jgi:CRISPR-associated Cas5-like protein
MKPYPIELEISGPTAMWTRPDTGSSPVSYVAPTFSAAKGLFESVLRWKSVKGGASDLPVADGDPPNGMPSPHRLGGRWQSRMRCFKRVGRGQGEVSNPVFSNAGPPAEPKPLLGREGWFRPESRVCETENHELPTMLRMVAKPRDTAWIFTRVDSSAPERWAMSISPPKIGTSGFGITITTTNSASDMSVWTALIYERYPAIYSGECRSERLLRKHLA